jgi:hypothetical protein
MNENTVIIDGAAIVAIGGAVTALTQLIKWAGVPDRFAALVVFLLSAIGIGIWAYSHMLLPQDIQSSLWDLFSGWIAVAFSAAGIYGFTRSKTRGKAKA